MKLTDTRAPYTTKRMLAVGRCTGGDEKIKITIADAAWLRQRYAWLIDNALGATQADIERWTAAIRRLEGE